MNKAIVYLQISLENLETSEPIHRAEGKIEQADADLKSIRDIKDVLLWLEGNWTEVSRIADADKISTTYELRVPGGMVVRTHTYHAGSFSATEGMVFVPDPIR
jgi:hypothetical protein